MMTYISARCSTTRALANSQLQDGPNRNWGTKMCDESFPELANNLQSSDGSSESICQGWMYPTASTVTSMGTGKLSMHPLNRP